MGNQTSNIAIVLMLCGIALLVYNALNYDQFTMSVSRVIEYSTETKLGITAGAVLLVGGALLYWRRPN